MNSEEKEVVDIIKKFEVINKDVMQMTRRLSEMKKEINTLKRKINSYPA